MSSRRACRCLGGASSTDAGPVGWSAVRRACGRMHDGLSRLLRAEQVGVEHEVVVGGQLGDPVEALEVVGAVRVSAGEELFGLALAQPARLAEASPSRLLRAGDEHPQYALAGAER